MGLKTSISSKKNKYEVPDERLQHIIHQGLKRRWCVDQAEWHDQELEVTALASSFNTSSLRVGMKTDRIQTDITDITFVFIFLFGFGFEYG